MNEVTEDQVKDFIVSIDYSKVGERTCVGLAKLKNGLEVCESSAYTEPGEFDMELEASIAFHRIKDKVRTLLGFKLMCELAERGEFPAVAETPTLDAGPTDETAPAT